MEDIVTRLRRAVDNEPFMLGGEHDLLKDALMEITTLLGCCDGAAAQDAHVRREREEHRAEVDRQRAEIERLRAALEGIDALNPDALDALVASDLRVIVAQMGDLARGALEGKP